MINDRLPTHDPSVHFPIKDRWVQVSRGRRASYNLLVPILWSALQSSFNRSTDVLLFDYRVAIPSPRALTLIVLVSSG